MKKTNSIVTSGKYAGQTYQQVLENDYSYFKRYLSRHDISQTLRNKMELYKKLHFNKSGKRMIEKVIETYPELNILLKPNFWTINNIFVYHTSDVIYFREGDKDKSLKPGKFLKRLLTDVNIEVKNEWLEKIADIKKSLKCPYDIKVFDKTEDINKYYSYYNYVAQTNTLGNSCMRTASSDRIKWYGLNGVKLVTLYDPKTDKIAARALLWDEGLIVRDKPIKLMDRVYTIKSTYREVLLDWAKKNGYHHRTKFTAGYYDLTSPDGNKIYLSNKIKFKEKMKITSRIPYLDTIKVVA